MNKFTEATVALWEKTKPKFVTVDADRLEEIASKNALGNFALPSWEEPGILPRDGHAFATHIFWHNAVNFSYTNRLPKDEARATFRKRMGNRTLSGSFAMARCFFAAFGEKPIYADDIIELTDSADRIKKFFSGMNALPLIKERRGNLRRAAFALKKNFGGDPWNIIVEGGWRAFGTKRKPGVVDILIGQFPSVFANDKTRFGNGTAFFYKRAQLFALEYEGRARAGGLRPISGMKEMGPIADYELPRSYRHDGIFAYDGGLERSIQKRRPLRPGSRAETEIRIATVWAQVRELEIMNAKRKRRGLKPLHMGHLDQYRWRKGRAVKSMPHHLCFSTNY